VGSHNGEDLYYHLNVVPPYIPPWRERKEDIVPFALDLLLHFNVELRKRFTGFTPAAAELLQQYRWPGNIRELQSVIERTMILAPKGISMPRCCRKRSANMPAPAMPPRKCKTTRPPSSTSPPPAVNSHPARGRGRVHPGSPCRHR